MLLRYNLHFNRSKLLHAFSHTLPYFSLSVTIAHHFSYKTYYVFEQFSKSDLDKLTVRSRYV